MTSAAVVVAMAGPGFAAGIKGDPQPELAPFSIGTGTTYGTVAIEPDGTMVTAYDAPYESQGELKVCVLARGASKCKTTATLMSLSSDSVFGDPQVFALNNNDIEVLQEACCDTDTAGGDLLFQSTDGGGTFGPPIRVGTNSVDTAAVVGSDLIYADGEDSSGANINAISLFAPADPTAVPELGPDEDTKDITVTNDDGNLIVADTDFEHSTDVTYVYEALAGSDFTSAASYTKIGTFSGEDVLGASGGALLTLVDSSSNDKVDLRVLGGTSYSSPVAVPDYSNHGPYEWYVDQDPSGRITILSILAAHGYDLYATRTTNGGKTFSAPENIHNATKVSSAGLDLDSIGSGIMVASDGGDSSPDVVYPILAQATVSLKVQASREKLGHSDDFTGTVKPATDGGAVYLQTEKNGKWYTVADSTQKSTGDYTFHVTEHTAETLTFRVESKDRAGYVEYGYSGAHKVTFYKPKPHH